MVIYNPKDLDNDKFFEGDPCLHFYEFQLLLCRVAYEERRKRNDEKFDLSQVITYFFENLIGIRKNDDVEAKSFPNINKKLYTRLNKYTFYT